MHLGFRKTLDLTDASVFYSYRTPVALIIPKHKLILITSTSHSSSTSRHTPREHEFPHRGNSTWSFIYVALSDCLGVDYIYDKSTPVIDPDTGARQTPKVRLKKRNPDEVSFVDWRAFGTFSGPVQWRMELSHRATQYQKTALRARTEWSITSARKSADDCIRQAEIVCARFGLPAVPVLPTDEVLAATMKIDLAKRKIAQAKMREAQEKRSAERAAAEKEMLAQAAVNRQRWIEGVWDGRIHHSLPIALRVQGDKVQTSNGTSVSLIGARRAWPVLQEARARVYDAGKPLYRADLAERVREVWDKFFHPFEFRHLTQDQLRVGCSNIPWSEIERIAPTVMAQMPVVNPLMEGV